MADSVRLTADRLRRVGSEILRTGGSAASEADLVAEHLVLGDLMGHDSHRVGMIPAYVRHLQAGLVVPNTRAKVVKDDGAILMFDGLRGYGRCVAGEAMAAAIARCRQTGVVALTSPCSFPAIPSARPTQNARGTASSAPPPRGRKSWRRARRSASRALTPTR